MKRLVVLFCILLAFAMVMAACQPAASPTTQAQAEVSVPEISEQAKIVMIVSQPKGEPFATLVDNGMQKLKSEMGENLDYRLVESLDKAEYTEHVECVVLMSRL